jgi:UDP-N-acetylmuramate dehydrogenase
VSVAIEPRFAPHVLRDEPLSRHTSWHVGGPADVFFMPRDREELAAFLRTLPRDVPLLWLGLGSNLLVRDGGVRGVVIATQDALSSLERRGDTGVYVEAGVPCARLARQCARWNIGPASFFAGIPGTLGGALAMNAGAFGGETWPHVRQVETLDRAGDVHVREAGEYRTGYRSVTAPAEGEWFIAATLQFESGADETRMRELLERRRQTQPIGEWSCGSVFTNPPGDHAARLIEATGLKGARIGGAVVSEKHANFILNEGEASARDIEQLIAHVQAEVRRRHGLQLETEVRIVGEAA